MIWVLLHSLSLQKKELQRFKHKRGFANLSLQTSATAAGAGRSQPAAFPHKSALAGVSIADGLLRNFDWSRDLTVGS